MSSLSYSFDTKCTLACYICFLQDCDCIQTHWTQFIYFNRPPKSSIKPQSPVLTDDEEEEDQELIEAKIVLRDVSTADIFQTDLELLDQFYSDFCGPLVRLSPPPGEKDYHFNLSENEGVCDLFDITT